eukprot:4273794-Alexandrium_andersonii.AAC.1
MEQQQRQSRKNNCLWNGSPGHNTSTHPNCGDAHCCGNWRSRRAPALNKRSATNTLPTLHAHARTLARNSTCPQQTTN